MTNQNIANVVVAVLKEIEMDGEMMEWIINQVGMRDQMVKQLVTNKEEMNEDLIVASFTKNALIEYTRLIQARALAATTEAIKSSGVDFESYVELDLYDKNIEVSVDDDDIYSEIVSNVEDVFETDDDSVWDEAANVILFMK
jgi:hypothetical protein